MGALPERSELVGRVRLKAQVIDAWIVSACGNGEIEAGFVQSSARVVRALFVRRLSEKATVESDTVGQVGDR